MRTDRELLELAAKAAAIRIDRVYTDDYPPMSLPAGYLVIINGSGGHSFWNPLDDDGDALRLAVKLELDIVFLNGDTIVLNACEGGGDPTERTRRAIVHAAAEIGAQVAEPTKGEKA